MIKKRKAIGKLFTTSQDFLILEWRSTIEGTEDETEIDADTGVFYYPRPGVIDVVGSYVYKQFPQKQEIYIYVEEKK